MKKSPQTQPQIDVEGAEAFVKTLSFPALQDRFTGRLTAEQLAGLKLLFHYLPETDKAQIREFLG